MKELKQVIRGQDLLNFTFKIVAMYSAKKGAFHNKGSSMSLASRGDATRLSFGRFY
ncbi:hypothetical protein Anas_10956, partial [Armadillidium nasatum]